MLREVEQVHPLDEHKTWPEIRNKLRQWRKENVRCSDKIVELGEYAIKHYSANLGREKWAVFEQVFVYNIFDSIIFIMLQCVSNYC